MNDPEIKLGEDGELEYEYDIETDDFKLKGKPRSGWQRKLQLPMYAVMPLAFAALFAAIVLLINTYSPFLCYVNNSCENPLDYLKEIQQYAPAPPFNDSRVMSVHEIDITGERIIYTQTATPAAYTTPMCATSFEAIQRTGRIMFTAGEGDNAEIFIIDDNSENLCRLTNNLIEEQMIAWSPDGTQIAFVSQPDGRYGDDIYLMNLDGSGIVNLTNDRAMSGRPAWSPDGNRIAYTSDRDGTGYNIFVVNRDGTGQVNLTGGDAYGISSITLNDWSPSWKPDGGLIAFTSGRDGDPNNFEIYTVNPSIGIESVQRITANGVNEYGVLWSPNGQQLLYYGEVIDDAGVYQGIDIFIIDANGQNRRRIGNELSEKGEPVWSPDGTQIAFVGRYTLYIMKVDGSGLRALTHGLKVRFAPQWR